MNRSTLARTFHSLVAASRESAGFFRAGTGRALTRRGDSASVIRATCEISALGGTAAGLMEKRTRSWPAFALAIALVLAVSPLTAQIEIGRASCRERVYSSV